MFRNFKNEQREFEKVFFALGGGRFDYQTIFDDFLTITCCALAHQTQEEIYLQTIKKYERKHLDDFVQMFSLLMMQYSLLEIDEWCDPLGSLYEEITSRAKSSALGQFFTPPTICDMMTQMTIDKDFGKNISDPCSGSGRMILSCNAFAQGNKYFANDLDHICCKMTAINMAGHKINGVVEHKDTLKNNEPYRRYVINYQYWKYKQISIYFN